MKGTIYGLRSTQLSLIVIVLMSTSIFLWALEKSPLLTSLLPHQSLSLQLTPDNHASSSENETITEETSDTRKEISEEIFTSKGEEDRNYNETLGETISNKETNGNMGALSGSDNTSSLSNGEDSKDSRTPMKKQACSYAEGKWVVDDTRPLYSGFDCKQWLSPMWSCRLTQRIDFSYEKLRWQPKDCQMEEFEGSKFLKRMQGKSLAFVGDSLGRQQFQSLMCMITGGKKTDQVLDVGDEFGLAMPVGAARPNGWAYRFTKTNTTILYYWSASLCALEPIDPQNPNTYYALHLDRPPEFLRRYLNKINVLVLNTGHHWNRGKFRANRWAMYVDGKPNTDKKLAPIGSAKDFTVRSIVKWMDSQLGDHPGLKAFYRSISPRHFVNGDWNTGGSCNNTTPMSVGKELVQDESSDVVAAEAVKGTGVKLLDITGMSGLRDEGHMSRFSITGTPGVQDCLHWCLPGVPDTWNEVLAAQI